MRSFKFTDGRSIRVLKAEAGVKTANLKGTKRRTTAGRGSKAGGRFLRRED